MPGLQAVRRAERLRDDDEARGAADRDPVLERRVLLVVDVEPDVDLAQVVEQPVVGHAMRDVDHVVLVLRRHQQLLAMRRRAADEQHLRRVAAHVRPEEEAVGDRQRQRAPDRQDPLGGRGHQRIERDDPVEVERIDGAQVLEPPLEVGVRLAVGARERLGQEADRERRRRPRTRPPG